MPDSKPRRFDYDEAIKRLNAELDKYPPEQLEKLKRMLEAALHKAVNDALVSTKLPSTTVYSGPTFDHSALDRLREQYRARVSPIYQRYYIPRIGPYLGYNVEPSYADVAYYAHIEAALIMRDLGALAIEAEQNARDLDRWQNEGGASG